MPSRLTRGLVIATTLLTSLHGAGGLNRALVEMPAWQQTGPLAWAAFSRHADLGITALILYPSVAFGGLILGALAVVSFHRDCRQPRAATIPLYATVLMVAGGLLATTQAAPIMLSVRSLGDDTAALQQALDGFQFWGGVREAFQLSAFLASVWALVAIHSPALPSKEAGEPPSRGR